MFNKILVAFDGSSHAEKALKVALDLSKKYNAEITAISVARIPDFADTRDEVNGALQDAEKFFTKPLEQAKKIASTENIALETRVVPGHPADVLVHTAQEEGYDLIVIGARGLSGFKRLLLGSVSEMTVHHAHCPVLVVKK